MQILSAALATSFAQGRVFGLTTLDAQKVNGPVPIAGAAYLQIADKKETLHFMYHAPPKYLPVLGAVLSRAGAAIPNRIRDAVHASQPTTALAWWMCVINHFSTIRPARFYISDTDNEWRYGESLDGVEVGYVWTDPLGASLSAIEAAGLLSPERGEVLPGEWMYGKGISKEEFARRILQDPKARFRDAEVLWNSYEKQQRSENKWIFRLDTLPDSAQEP